MVEFLYFLASSLICKFASLHTFTNKSDFFVYVLVRMAQYRTGTLELAKQFVGNGMDLTVK